VVVGFQGGQGSGEEQGEFSLLPSTLFFAKVIESMDLADERFSLLFVSLRFLSHSRGRLSPPPIVVGGAPSLVLFPPASAESDFREKPRRWLTRSIRFLSTTKKERKREREKKVFVLPSVYLLSLARSLARPTTKRVRGGGAERESCSRDKTTEAFVVKRESAVRNTPDKWREEKCESERKGKKSAL
jgi:hypothetical protein